MKRLCWWCKEEFETENPEAHYCSRECAELDDMMDQGLIEDYAEEDGDDDDDYMYYGPDNESAPGVTGGEAAATGGAAPLEVP
jgi:hypothetical protein